MKVGINLCLAFIGGVALTALSQGLPPTPVCFAPVQLPCADETAQSRTCQNGGVIEPCDDVILVHGSYTNVVAAGDDAGRDSVDTNCGIGTGLIARFSCVGGDNAQQCTYNGPHQVQCANRCPTGGSCGGGVH